MVGLLIIILLLAIGFAAGYGARGLISRKRQTEYLKFQPYISPRLRPRQPPSDHGTRTRDAASEPAMTERRLANHDITRSFQHVSILGSKPAKPAGANLHLVQAHRPEPSVHRSPQPSNRALRNWSQFCSDAGMRARPVLPSRFDRKSLAMSAGSHFADHDLRLDLPSCGKQNCPGRLFERKERLRTMLPGTPDVSGRLRRYPAG